MTTAKRKPAPRELKPFKPDKPRLTATQVRYSDQIADRILKRIGNGESLRAICEDADMPDRITVMRWLDDKPDFATKHARARARQQDAMADDCVFIADTERDPTRARNRILSRQWHAAKLAPKKYGDKLEHSGSVDGNIHVTFAAEDEKIM